MRKFELELGNVPPSQNTRRGEHWSKTRKRKSDLQGDLMIVLLHQKVPKKLVRVHATAVITLPKNRRRDEGNYRDVIEKALGDTLQLGWLPDDTPDYFTFGEITFEQGKERLVIKLDVETGQKLCLNCNMDACEGGAYCCDQCAVVPGSHSDICPKRPAPARGRALAR